MTLNKRGLGRGLEALLAEDPAKAPVGEKIQPTPMATKLDDGRVAMVTALIKNIQKEHLTLLEEAESLRLVIEEFESIVRADLL
jgi:hypothetical protein